MTERQALALRHDHRAGDHREVDGGVGAQQGRLPGGDKATKPEIKAAVEALFKVKVTSVNTLNRKGKNKRFRGITGKQKSYQESDRDARRGPVDRRDDRPLRRGHGKNRWH